MYKIYVDGRRPQEVREEILVQRDNNSEVIRFELDAVQGSVNLQNLQGSIKLMNSIDLIDMAELVLVEGAPAGKLWYDWTPSSSNLNLSGFLRYQLDFSDGNIVWQTIIAEIPVADTLFADEICAEHGLTYVRQLQEQITNYKKFYDHCDCDN